MVVRYYIDQKQLPGEPDNNWRIVPEAARSTLEKQALADAARPQLQ
jgi:hypothetical protein